MIKKENMPDSLISFCLQYQVIPIELTDHILKVATTQVLTPQQESALQFSSGRTVQGIIYSVEQFEHQKQLLLRQHSEDKLEVMSVQEEPQSYYKDDSLDDEPVIKFINQILDMAIEYRASDIHFEPYAQSYRVRFRVDGVLEEVNSPPKSLAARLAARLKILAQLNIAEKRLPQDGQITLPGINDDYSVRISTLPVIDGEKIVLRMMKAGQQPLDISQLGMPEELQKHYLDTLNLPQGLILVTGPTGSGKSITLYSGLKTRDHRKYNICSVEDPVEIILEGINQVQVNAKTGLFFNQVLRAFLRQDPDVIMIGEIRDQETAEIAIESAQTGHLVLSTLHTNSTLETLTRLKQMGIASYLIVSCLKLVIAQRLVRCLCPRCKQAYPYTTRIESPYWQGDVQDWFAVGCDYCLNGYYGRTGVYEALVVTEFVKQMIITGCNLTELEARLVEKGMSTLFVSGIQKVQDGITSLAEVYRMIGSPHLFSDTHTIIEQQEV